VKLFRMTIDTDSNPDDDAPIVKGKDSTVMEEKDDYVGRVSNERKDALVHDLILVVKSAMTKVSSRDQLWCDIINKTEKDIRRVVDQAIK
jgi:hypothetical protein